MADKKKVVQLTGVHFYKNGDVSVYVRTQKPRTVRFFGRKSWSPVLATNVKGVDSVGAVKHLLALEEVLNSKRLPGAERVTEILYYLAYGKHKEDSSLE